ncbi:MAG: hypothetical protein K2J76_05995 [Oscillospiraceae bacterium]|nr:hypothetical protein [Oscillospiraceae bacterium]
MKKFILILAIFATLTACNGADSAGEATTTEFDTETTTTANETTSATSEKKTANSSPKETHIPVAITPSPDKYTWYIKDYVGKNCATIGYTGISGNRYDHYGDTTIKLNLIADGGSFIDANDDEELKRYYVTEQSIEPNTEFKLTFNEEWNSVDYQSIEEIDLYVSLVE